MRTNRVVSTTIRSAALALAGLMVLSACDPEIPQRDGEPVDRVEPIFDPVEGIIPLPNDAALDDGTLPGLPGAEEGTVEEEFSNYLQLLRGWLPDTAIEIPFSGPLDEETIDDEAVLLYRLGAEGELESVEIAGLHYTEGDDGPSMLVVEPDETPVEGERFAAVVTRDVRGANGERVGTPLPIFLAASPEPLVDADGQPTLGILEDDPETAQSLEGLRMMLEPVFNGLEALEEDSIDRDDVATAFLWTVVPNTRAALDAEAGIVPLPNTLALDEDGTFPAAGTCEAGEPTAQGHFDDYLADLHGWPDATPITLPLTGPVDVDSIGADEVQLWVADGEDWERIEDISVTYRDEDVDPCTGEASPAHVLDIVPDESMDTRQQYFAFATQDIEEADGGHGIIPEAPMYLALQPFDLLDEDGESTLSVVSDEDARAIQGLRDVLQPVMATIEAQTDLDYTDLASVWSWFTWTDTFVLFDPTTGEVPFPNLLMVDQEDGTVNLPIPEGADPMTEAILESLNHRLGFSSHAPGWIPLDGKVDPDTVNTDSLLIADADSFGLLSDDEYTVRYEEEWDRIVYEPLISLAPQVLHAPALLQTVIGENGRPVQAPPLFVFIRNPSPLIDENGESTIDVLDDALAQQLEPVREGFESQLFWVLMDNLTQTDREDLAVAWAFEPENPTFSMIRYRARAMAVLDERDSLMAQRECEVEEACNGEDDHLVELDDEIDDPDGSGAMIDTTNLRAVYTGGEFTSLAVDTAEEVVGEGDERVGISVYLPEEDQGAEICERPFDIMIAQHGLGSDRSRGGIVAMANEAAAYPSCKATVAMDFALHGGRSMGADSPHPETFPADSGDGFFSEDLVTSKGNFVQSIVDLFTLVAVIEGDGEESGLENLFEELLDDEPGQPEPLFGGDISYIGASLGGILGVPFTALEPAVDNSVLHTAGGRMKWILEGDEEGVSDIGAPLLDAMGLEPGDLELFQSLTMVQWLADRIDPVAFSGNAEGGHRTLTYDSDEDTFGPTIGDSCDNDSDCDDGWMCESVGDAGDVCTEYVGESEFLLQMAVDDRVIVNRSTDALARSLGIPLDETTFEDVSHAFMAVVDPSDDEFEAAQCAREQAVGWMVEGYEEDGGELFVPGGLSAEDCLSE